MLLRNLIKQQEEIRKPSSAINAKKQRKTIEWERLEISSRILEHLLFVGWGFGQRCKEKGVVG